jgi:hypothetical protein
MNDTILFLIILGLVVLQSLACVGSGEGSKIGTAEAPRFFVYSGALRANIVQTRRASVLPLVTRSSDIDSIESVDYRWLPDRDVPLYRFDSHIRIAKRRRFSV